MMRSPSIDPSFDIRKSEKNVQISNQPKFEESRSYQKITKIDSAERREFDNQEKHFVSKKVTQIWQQKEQKSIIDELETKKLGILPENWYFSKYNPDTIRRMRDADNWSDDEICCGCISRNGDQEMLEDRGSCIDKLVFSEENLLYLFFNFIVSVLNLVSSYFYIYLAAFRSETSDEQMQIVITFECIFGFHMLL